MRLRDWRASRKVSLKKAKVFLLSLNYGSGIFFANKKDKPSASHSECSVESIQSWTLRFVLADGLSFYILDIKIFYRFSMGFNKPFAMFNFSTHENVKNFISFGSIVN